MAADTAHTSKHVIVAIDFFPLYRGPVLTELVRSPNHAYTLAGDDHDCMDGTIRTWEVPAEVPWIRTPAVRLPGPFRWIRHTIGFALRRDVDCIIYHANPHLLNTWVSSTLARLAGKRVLFFAIGWYHDNPPLRRLMKKLYYHIPHGLVLYGHYAKMMGIREGIDPDRLYVVYNSLDYDTQKQLRANLDDAMLRQTRRDLFGDDGDRPQVICTSRLTPKRKLDELIDALALLQQQGHAVNLLLVGDGPEKQHLQEHASARDVNVHFYGACYEEPTLARLIASSNVTVAPGMVGLTAMHSLAYGTPVITHNVPSEQSPEWEIIIDGFNGGFFERGNSADLAREIRAWTDTSMQGEAVRANCWSMLDRIYNPRFQRRAFDWAVSGRPAHDLFWMFDDA